MPSTRRGLLRDRSSSALKSIVQSSIKEHSATSLFAQAALTSFSKKSLASTLLSRDFGKQRKASIVSIFGVSSNHALDHSWGCLIYSSCLPVQGLQVRGATRLHTTDFGLGDAHGEGYEQLPSDANLRAPARKTEATNTTSASPLMSANAE